jgi:hypothetical protein
LGEITESAGSIYSVIKTSHKSNFRPKTVTYEVVMNGVETLNFTADFQGSRNYEMFPAKEFKKDSKAMKIKAKIRPFHRIYLGYLQITDVHESSHLHSHYSCETEEAHPDDLEVFLSQFHRALENGIQRFDDHHINLYSLEQDSMSKRTIGELIAADAKFVHFDFRPGDHALYKTDISKRRSSESTKKAWVAQWKRPTEFMNDPNNIGDFQGSISADDIKQGHLGNCWFLSTLAAMTEFPELIKDIFRDSFAQRSILTENGEKTGVSPVGLYHLCFYKGGLKTTIRIDDYIPCEPGPKLPNRYGPLFSKSNGDELWVLLAEKAFAKIHGSYTFP